MFCHLCGFVLEARDEDSGLCRHHTDWSDQVWSEDNRTMCLLIHGKWRKRKGKLKRKNEDSISGGQAGL
jgi:hypothetical protein